MSPPQSGAAPSAPYAAGRIMSRGGGSPFDRGILAIVSLILPRSAVFAALLCCFSAVFLPGLASAGEPRSYAAKREFQREHPCPSTARATNTPGVEGALPKTGRPRMVRQVSLSVGSGRGSNLPFTTVRHPIELYSPPASSRRCGRIRGRKECWGAGPSTAVCIW
jgi:hypothetical protein